MKPTIINLIIFFGPLFIANTADVSAYLNQYFDSTTVAVIISGLLHLIKKTIEENGKPN